MIVHLHPVLVLILSSTLLTGLRLRLVVTSIGGLLMNLALDAAASR